MTDKPRPGDALVVFGITGDLAKQMTLRSLYRRSQTRFQHQRGVSSRPDFVSATRTSNSS